MQGRIESKLEGGSVGSGGQLMTRVRCIQQFQIHFPNKQQNFEVIVDPFNLSVSESFSPGSHSSKGAHNFQKRGARLASTCRRRGNSP